MENSLIAAPRRDKGEAAHFASAGDGYANLCPGLNLKPRQNVAFSTYIE